jgi:hypothetical protein
MWQEERQATGKRSLRKTDNSVELRAVVSPVGFSIYCFVFLLFCGGCFY